MNVNVVSVSSFTLVLSISAILEIASSEELAFISFSYFSANYKYIVLLRLLQLLCMRALITSKFSIPY